MSVEPIQAALGLPRAEAASRRLQWIESPAFDLAFFVLAPLLGIVFATAAPSGHGLLILVVGSLLGIPHYLSTYTFYLWDDTQAYRRSRWLEFIAAPLGIVLAFTVMMIVGAKAPLLFLLYFWNAFHIARQSCGILSIYRHAAGATTLADKHAANAALLAVNGCCLVWSLEWNPTVYPYLARIWVPLPKLIWIVSLAVAIGALLHLGRSLLRRRAEGRAVQFPELAFLASSLLLFLPYLWVRDWNRAGFAVLTGHFLQYLGIVWLIHRRKLREAVAAGSAGQRVLARVSQDARLLFAAILTVGAVFLVLPRASRAVPWPDFYAWLTGIFVFLHFYLDGLFWAMKRPEIRKSMAPYLLPRPA